MMESRNKRVLIVDNDEEEAARLGTVLQREGYDADATWSGIEALERLKSGEFDVVLVSHYLPDVYVGDFFQRLNRLPVHPCSFVMQEGQVPATTVQKIKNLMEEERQPAK